MKLFLEIVVVILFLGGIVIGLWLPFAHPELTDAQLLLEYPLHFIFVIVGVSSAFIFWGK